MANSGGGHHAHETRRGSKHEAEDDLKDLMEVFDFFDVFDGEAADLESQIGHSHQQQREGVMQGSSSSLALVANIQNRKLAQTSPLQQPTSRNEMEVEPSVVLPAAMGQQFVVHHEAKPTLPPVALKSKRGRKKKEETLARLASANGSDGEAVRKDALAGTDEEKERLRRESNKHSARNSRKKKKEYIIVLSEAISSLTKEVQQLRQDLARKASEDERRERLACIGRNAFLEALDSHGPISHKRKLSSAYQFENLTRNVAPPHTRFLLWSVARKATEPDSVAARTWHEVATVLSLQPEQQERLAILFRSKKATDTAAADERDKLQFVFSGIQRLRSNVEQLAGRMDAYNRGLLGILSPVQHALLYQYIEEMKLEKNANHSAANYAFGSQGGAEVPLTPELQRLRSVLSAPRQPPSTGRGSAQSEEMGTIDFLLNMH